MNAGIVYEDSDVPMSASEKKLRKQLKDVKEALTHKRTLPELAEYGILTKKLRALTGSPVM